MLLTLIAISTSYSRVRTHGDRFNKHLAGSMHFAGNLELLYNQLSVPIALGFQSDTDSLECEY
jgi:hypothetical protein